MYVNREKMDSKFDTIARKRKEKRVQQKILVLINI